MSSGSLNAINFRDILSSSEDVLKDLGSTSDEKRFLRDLRKINDLNQKRYETELSAHGKRQDEMKLMLVKEKIKQINERQRREREGVVGLAAGSVLGDLAGGVKDQVIAQSTDIQSLANEFNSEISKISDAFVEKAKKPNATNVTTAAQSTELPAKS